MNYPVTYEDLERYLIRNKLYYDDIKNITVTIDERDSCFAINLTIRHEYPLKRVRGENKRIINKLCKLCDDAVLEPPLKIIIQKEPE